MEAGSSDDGAGRLFIILATRDGFDKLVLVSGVPKPSAGCGIEAFQGIARRVCQTQTVMRWMRSCTCIAQPAPSSDCTVHPDWASSLSVAYSENTRAIIPKM
jgi:hypothetical protein